jgi:hypothetical protein
MWVIKHAFRNPSAIPILNKDRLSCGEKSEIGGAIDKTR